MSNNIMNMRQQMESDYDIKDIIVIDNGADTIKIGISGEDYPRIIMDAVAGIPEKKQQQGQNATKQQALFGPKLKQLKEDKKFQGKITEKRLIAEGKIPFEKISGEQSDNDDLELMKDLWTYCLDQLLQVNDILSCNLLIIDQPHNDKDYKHKIANILFEEMKVNSILFMNSASLSLYSTGTTTGLVVESGHSLTSTVPIFEGFPIAHAMHKTSIAGEEVTKLLDKLLQKRQLNIDLLTVKDIKEKMCHVASDYYTDLNGPTQLTVDEKSYELPDGQIITITNEERYTPTEILFNPNLIGDNITKNITSLMLDSLNRCDIELQHELYSNIVLCGGSSLFRGMLPRIQKELGPILPNYIQKKDINFVQNTHCRYSAWIGGSMLGSLSTFQQLAISRSEYEESQENKVSIIHKKTV